MILRMVLVDTGEELDRIDGSGDSVTYATGLAEEFVQPRAAREGLPENAVLEDLAGWSNGYLLFEDVGRDGA